MKILVVGADGQLGTDLGRVIPAAELIPLTIKDLDITNRAKTLEVIKRQTPDVVINTAAYHRVDDCEDNEALAFAVNAIGAKNLAQACLAVDAALLHMSTDYVFDGEKGAPYTELDAPNPLSVYGVSKLAGELFVKYLMKKYFIIRSSGLYGVAGCLGKGGGNFVDNMLKRAQTQKEFRVVNDEILSPTYTLDLAGKIAELIKTANFGLYHLVNQGQCSWYEFALKIFDLAEVRVAVAPVSAKVIKNKARRPSYSVLRSEKVGGLRSWQQALAAYLLEKQRCAGQ